MSGSYRITESLSIPSGEFAFRFSRSAGKGGQNVNKVSTRVEVTFDILGSPSLREFERTLLLSRLRSRIDSSGSMTVSSDRSRSQWQNREDAVRRLCDLLRLAIVPDVPRISTRPSQVSRRKRREGKEKRAATKRLRRAPEAGNRGED
jgi:ribosome-associated protein